MSVILDIHYYHCLSRIPRLIRMVFNIQQVSLPQMTLCLLERQTACAL